MIDLFRRAPLKRRLSLAILFVNVVLCLALTAFALR